MLKKHHQWVVYKLHSDEFGFRFIAAEWLQTRLIYSWVNQRHLPASLGPFYVTYKNLGNGRFFLLPTSDRRHFLTPGRTP